MNITHIDQLREIVREERERRGLSQSEAAALMGYTQKWLSNFESGRVDPPVSMVINMMALLGIPLQAGSRPEPTPHLPEADNEQDIGFDMKL